jgi:hypothetical protein
MKAVAAILLCASSIHAMLESSAGHWVRVWNCDAKTMATHLGPVLVNATVEPCVMDVGLHCFKPNLWVGRNKCARKFAASANCAAVWPMIANAFGSIHPPCEFARSSTAYLARIQYAEFTLAMYKN